MIRHRLRFAAAPVTLLVLLTGCGGDGDSAEPAGTTTTTDTNRPPSTETSMTTTGPSTTSTTLEKELTAESRVRLDGIGPIRVGMTLAEATEAVGRTVAVDPDSLLDGEEALCGFAEVTDSPEGLLFMVGRAEPGDEWRINRIDVVEPSLIATAGGVRIGASEDDVKRIYGTGRIKVEPHHYTGPEGHYLTLDVDGRGGLLLLFETDGTQVLRYRSGEEEAVRSVEGCA